MQFPDRPFALRIDEADGSSDATRVQRRSAQTNAQSGSSRHVAKQAGRRPVLRHHEIRTSIAVVVSHRRPALFPLEVAVGTPSHVAILNASSTKVGLRPELVRELVAVLGDGAVRVVGGVTVEVQEKKRWEKRKPAADDGE